MPLENRKALSRLRIEKADVALKDAKMLLELGGGVTYPRIAPTIRYSMQCVQYLPLTELTVSTKCRDCTIQVIVYKKSVFENYLSDTIRDVFDLCTDSVMMFFCRFQRRSR